MSKLESNYYLIGVLSDKFCGDNLPSHKNVLSRFLHCHLIRKKTIIESTKVVAIELENIYKAEFIPTQHPCRIKKKIKDLHSLWLGVKKNKWRKISPAQQVNEKGFLQMLNVLFDVSLNGSLKSMAVEDKERLGFTAPVDQAMKKYEKRAEYWSQVKEKRQQQQDAMRSIRQSTVHDDVIENPEPEKTVSIKTNSTSHLAQSYVLQEVQHPTDDQYDSDDSYVPPNIYRKLKVKKKENIMTPELSTELDRARVTNRDSVRILVFAAIAMDKNPNKMVMNRESFRQSRAKNRITVAAEIRETFNPEHVQVVHWDGKMLAIQDTIKKVDRIAVVVSGGGRYKQLGIPFLTKSSGINQAHLVHERLQYWKLLDKVNFMSFDTTSVNTGRLNGTCKQLEKLLGRRLLYLACRHHILEIIISKVYQTALKDVSVGPNITLFERFKNSWDGIDKSRYQSGLEDPEFADFLLPIKEKLILFVNHQLLKYKHRDDYKEVLTLTLFLLGEKPIDHSILICGALHRARWMARIIYCIKIYLFRSVFVLTSEELTGIRNFILFTVSTFIEYWFKAPSTTTAARNDLQMLKDFENYSKFNADIAKAASKAFSRHLWYLSEYLSIFALFDDSLKSTEKKELVEALKKKGAKNAPVRAKIDWNKVMNYKLSDFVTKNSMTIFTSLKIPHDFLNCEPKTWYMRKDYNNFKSVIQNLFVVNDVAERTIALAKTYNKRLTKNEIQRQLLYQVVEKQRYEYPDANKKTLLKNFNK